jgi:hypothetical protein
MRLPKSELCTANRKRPEGLVKRRSWLITTFPLKARGTFGTLVAILCQKTGFWKLIKMENSVGTWVFENIKITSPKI